MYTSLLTASTVPALVLAVLLALAAPEPTSTTPPLTPTERDAIRTEALHKYVTPAEAEEEIRAYTAHLESYHREFGPRDQWPPTIERLATFREQRIDVLKAEAHK